MTVTIDTKPKDILDLFRTNGSDISSPLNAFDINRILFNGARHIDTTFMNPAIQALLGNVSSYQAEEEDEDDRKEMQFASLMALERQQQLTLAAAEAIKKAGEINEKKGSRNLNEKSRVSPAASSALSASTKDRNDGLSSDDKRSSRLNDTFGRKASPAESPSSITATVENAYKTAHQAVGDTIEAVGGRNARLAAREVERVGKPVLATAFKVATNPVGAAMDAGAAISKAATPYVSSAISTGWNWVKSWAP